MPARSAKETRSRAQRSRNAALPVHGWMLNHQGVRSHPTVHEACVPSHEMATVSGSSNTVSMDKPLAGSERAPMRGARSLGSAVPNARLMVSVVLRQPAADAFRACVADAQKNAADILTREQFRQSYGASEDDLARVRAFAARFGLSIDQEDAARRTVRLAGTVAQFNAAFGVDLETYEHDGGTYRGRVGPVHLPVDIANIVVAVLGLDDRPQANAHFRVRPAAVGALSYTPLQLASLYAFPAGSGNGQCIAIIELGGGFRPADLEQYFAQLSVPSPVVTAVSVDRAQNAPTGSVNGPDGEVMLDIEVAGAIAPAARIVVYFAPNTDAGFLDAITTAIHDTANAPTILSISWGGPESTYTQQALMAFDDAFATAVTLGVTVCVACGDNGSTDGVADAQNHVDFPASSPHVLACGGTRLQANGTTIASETVWNDGANGGATGGGISDVFALPAWQTGLAATSATGASALAKRGVPDICANADPQTGFAVFVDGRSLTIGGTSAVAPLWAGLIARINGMRGKPVGFINPVIYANATSLNDITQGDNGAFVAAPGWDACTGLGSPNGSKLTKVLLP